MELLLLSFCLLLLLGATHAQDDYVIDLDHPSSYFGRSGKSLSVEGSELLLKYLKLSAEVEATSVKEVDAPCNVSVKATLAFYVFRDLVQKKSQDEPNSGHIKWVLQRHNFYENIRFPDLQTAVKDNATFCSYAARLVCLTDKCANCSTLPPDTDAYLKGACNFNGDAGNVVPDEKLVQIDESQFGVEDLHLGKRTDGECVDGWLTAKDAIAWHTKMTQDDMKTFAVCTSDFRLQRALMYLHKLVDGKNAVQVQKDIDKHWDFYEELLWQLKDGNHTDVKLCSRKKYPDEGPWWCGHERVCVDCRKMSQKSGRYFRCSESYTPTDDSNTEKCHWTTTTTTTSTSTIPTNDTSSAVGVNWSGVVLLFFPTAVFLSV